VTIFTALRKVGAVAAAVGLAVLAGSSAQASVAAYGTGAQPGNVIVVNNPGDQYLQVGDTTSLQITATDSGSGQTLTFSATDLPPGVSISSTGLISGTLSAPGGFTSTITATDTSGATGSTFFHWVIPGVITLTHPANQATTIGGSVWVPVSATDTATQALGTYARLAYSQTGLPPSLDFDTSTGLISGWPEAAGTYHVSVTAEDGVSPTVTVSFTLTVSRAANAGVTGPIRLDLGGKCLDDTGNSAASGNKVQIWACNGDSAQDWTVVGDGTLRIHGKCLVISNVTANGSKGQLGACTGDRDQAWVFSEWVDIGRTPNVTQMGLINQGASKCLDDTGHSVKNGTQVQSWSCTGATNQEWTLPAGPARSEIAGECLDDTGNSAANGNKVQFWTCNGDSAQNWTFEPDGTLRIHGKCLDILNRGTTFGTPVQLWSCTGGANQQWFAGGEDAGFSTSVTNPATGFGLGVPGESVANGTRVVIGDGSIGFSWDITP
jgi:Ricin-type beta-trefoil lectin domain/Putative Ig domain